VRPWSVDEGLRREARQAAVGAKPDHLGDTQCLTQNVVERGGERCLPFHGNPKPVRMYLP
jgi:hypothetical protein